MLFITTNDSTITCPFFELFIYKLSSPFVEQKEHAIWMSMTLHAQHDVEITFEIRLYFHGSPAGNAAAFKSHLF